jgi:hypothetical protein
MNQIETWPEPHTLRFNFLLGLLTQVETDFNDYRIIMNLGFISAGVVELVRVWQIRSLVQPVGGLKKIRLANIF